MSTLNQLSADDIQETSMIDIMFYILQDERKPVSFYTLMNQIGDMKGLSSEEVQKRLAEVYTNLNTDGRFVTLGDNQWGLKSWYPVEQSQEELATTIKPKKRKKSEDDDVFEDDIEDDLEGLEVDDLDDDFEEDFDDDDAEEFDDNDADDDDDDEDFEDDEEEAK
ncbi:DNA-directed RNA polymerase subunit delta [Guptibacillus algicola]|uniref:DNA-directed RNA polymerase subunit delta n=1 Tax=Guptibacillus algicola TaxID=225844 RepID=UPI001CD40A8B|nr:DNA-directed RNA polymerase subunit delta [Alkalihalobacillus algicola]MCA0988967.1 DNA-directed RNA polymerase subunit delta [Alkalihalobacillus algicola]